MVFDINRIYAAQGLIKSPIDLESLLTGPPRSYGVSVVTNRDGASAAVVVRERPAGETGRPQPSWGCHGRTRSIRCPISHCRSRRTIPSMEMMQSENPGVRLGRLDLRGENRTLAIPNTAMTRQHWNPFF